jgi:putative transposase
MLPREYLPWQTVYYHFGKWRRDGRLRRAHDRLRAAVREAEGRDRDPSGAVIDSQAVKGTGVGGPERGYDGAKRLSGRKRNPSDAASRSCPNRSPSLGGASPKRCPS